MDKSKEKYLEYDAKENFGRLISIAKRHLDIWSHQNIKPANGDMKLSFMPVLFNISLEGNTNTELSKKSLVFKQSMSRTLKELEETGMITSTPIMNDKRSNKIHLTKEGEKFVIDSTEKLSKIVEQYVNLVGEKDFKTTLNVLSKIIDFHEGLNIEEE
jgi:DNA-binding MarR family transcriptional regulator